MTPPILRFAPSPNGRLHLGHAYAALFADRAARALGGTMLLRIEDIDRARCKPEFDAALRQDLAWLGLSWPEPALRQSERFPAYAGAAARLRDRGLLYPCFCSRSAVAAAASAKDPDGAPLYPGTCRHRDPAEAEARLAAGEPAQWRLRQDAARDAAGPLLAFVELDPVRLRAGTVAGDPVAARPELWGDAVLVRKDTPTSYHLAVVVDDAAQGVTHVTRGRDLFPATHLHRLLQALLGLPTPLYCHHRLIRDENQEKLAKSRSSPSLQSLREAGASPAAIRTRLGF